MGEPSGNRNDLRGEIPMKDIQILNNRFDRLCFMDNSVEDGLHYTADKLTTRIDTGVYVLEFKVPKHNPKSQHLKEGNYITFINNQNVRIFMNIRHVSDSGGYEKNVYCEDAATILTNSFAEAIERPKAPQNIDYYLNYILQDTGFHIGINECDGKAMTEYTTIQSILERIRAVMADYQMQFYFSTELTGKGPKFYLNIVKRRLEGQEGFYLSTDNIVTKIDRKVDIDHIITRLIVRGAEKTDDDKTPKTAPITAQPTKDENVERVIEIGMKNLGKPYEWGANGPNTFDCSGFVNYCFRQAKFPGYPTTGRPYTNSMWDRGGEHASYFTRIPANERKRGDMVMMDTGYTYPGDANHIGIYIGDNKMMHYANPGRVQSLDGFSVLGYLRVKGA